MLRSPPAAEAAYSEGDPDLSGRTSMRTPTRPTSKNRKFERRTESGTVVGRGESLVHQLQNAWSKLQSDPRSQSASDPKGRRSPPSRLGSELVSDRPPTAHASATFAASPRFEPSDWCSNDRTAGANGDCPITSSRMNERHSRRGPGVAQTARGPCCAAALIGVAHPLKTARAKTRPPRSSRSRKLPTVPPQRSPRHA